ncbi:HTH-type transcriptional repressor PurR [Streptomyces violarus]
MPGTPAAPDGKRPTLADVAARAGVSTALVSIVMREAKGAGAATRERVLQAARDIGYRPDARARLLRSQRSRLLGCSSASSSRSTPTWSRASTRRPNLPATRSR